MSGRSRDPVVLTSYSFDEKSSMDTYLDEWQSIRCTQAGFDGGGSETEDDAEKDDQGRYWRALERPKEQLHSTHIKLEFCFSVGYLEI